MENKELELELELESCNLLVIFLSYYVMFPCQRFIYMYS